MFDYGGREVPWYEPIPIGAVNFTRQPRPPEAPPEDRSQWGVGYGGGGGGGLGGFLTNIVNPILNPLAADPIKTAAMLAASVYAPYLIPVIAGADTAIAGGDVEDVLKSAATAYVSQAIGGEIKGAFGAEGIGLPSETPYIDLPDGEFLLTPDVSSVPSLLPEIGLTPTEIDQLTNLAPETGTEISAYTTPIEAPVIGQPYDATPLTDPVTGQPFGSIEKPLVDNYMDGFTSVSETGLATLPDEGMQPDLPGTTLLGDLGLAGAVETPIPSSGISAMDVLRGVNAAKGLLGSGQEQAVAPATQFRGTRVPQGQVDYSGILSLLQMQSPQRRSLLG